MAERIDSSLIVGPEATILEAIQKINKNSRQAVCVVDAQGHLAGLVTDGDIRRALATGKPLEEKVASIANAQPHVLDNSASQQEIQSLMLRHKIAQVPIVDGDGVLVSLETHQSILEKGHSSSLVVLMAGGKGTRLRPLTEERPKPLINIAGKPIIEMIIDNFIVAGYRDFYVSVNYLAHQIKDHLGNGERLQSTIRYLDETIPTGTAGSLALLPERPVEPFFIINADILTNLNLGALRQTHIDGGNILTVCARTVETQSSYGVLETDGDRVLRCVEKPTLRQQVNAGIYMASPEVLDIIGSEERFFNMTDLIDECISRDLRVGIFNIHEYWRDIGQLSDLQLARDEYEKFFAL